MGPAEKKVHGLLRLNEVQPVTRLAVRERK